MAYTLENSNFYLQPIHKLEQDMEENNCMQFVNKLNSSTFHIMIEFLDITEKKNPVFLMHHPTQICVTGSFESWKGRHFYQKFLKADFLSTVYVNTELL